MNDRVYLVKRPNGHNGMPLGICLRMISKGWSRICRQIQEYHAAGQMDLHGNNALTSVMNWDSNKFISYIFPIM